MAFNDKSNYQTIQVLLIKKKEGLFVRFYIIIL